MAHLSVLDTAPDTWDRGPQLNLVRERRRLLDRDAVLIRRLRVLLGRRTLGSDKRVEDRAVMVAKTKAEIDQVWDRIVEIDRL